MKMPSFGVLHSLFSFKIALAMSNNRIEKICSRFYDTSIKKLILYREPKEIQEDLRIHLKYKEG